MLFHPDPPHNADLECWRAAFACYSDILEECAAWRLKRRLSGKRRNTDWTAARLARLRTLLLEGWTHRELAERWGCRRTTIDTYARALGIPLPRARPRYTRTDRAITLYRAGASVEAIAYRTGFTWREVLALLATYDERAAARVQHTRDRVARARRLRQQRAKPEE